MADGFGEIGFLPSESWTIGATLHKIHNSKCVDVIVSVVAVVLAILAGVSGSIPCAVVGGVLCVYEFVRLVMRARRKPEEKVEDAPKSTEDLERIKAQEERKARIEQRAADYEKELEAKHRQEEEIRKKVEYRNARVPELLGKEIRTIPNNGYGPGSEKVSVYDDQPWYSKRAKELTPGDIVATYEEEEEGKDTRTGKFFAKIVEITLKDELGRPTQFRLEEADGKQIIRNANEVWFLNQDVLLNPPAEKNE